jgi:hypothetical protein
VSTEPAPATVEALLRRAAAADVADARRLLTRIDGVRLLELVVSQAELAVDDDRARPAGIDAIGEITRAAIEVMDLPQDISTSLEPQDASEPPTVTGWELVTVDPRDLEAATLTVAVPTWALALVAFSDLLVPGTGRVRRAVAAAADGRLVAVGLHLRADGGPADLRWAALAHEPAALGPDGRLAAALAAALTQAGQRQAA